MHVIVTRRLTLRPPLEVDAEPIADLLANPNVSRRLGPVPHPYTLEDALDFVRRRPSRDRLNYIVHRAVLIGMMGASEREGAWHFGYWLGEPHWGLGYASEALPAFLRVLFERTGAGRLESYVFADNPASLAVQRKVGCEEVGRSRRPSLARGCDVDGIDTVLTREAFERRCGELRRAA